MPLVAVIEQLTARIKEYDRKVEQLAEDQYPDTAALTPGVRSRIAHGAGVHPDAGKRAALPA